jgi:S-adenosylmethionine-dependent methyltransferase
VYFTDISSAEVERGRAHAEAEGVKLANATVVDALCLDQQPELFVEGKYDLVLCMGPLYHLLESIERAKVIEHCAHVTKPGGFVCAAFVTKWAHLRDVANKDPGRVFRESQFYAGYAGDGPRAGVYDRVEGRTGWHASGGNEVRKIVEGEASLDVDNVVACEAFLGGGLSASLVNEGKDVFQRWVDLCWQVARAEDSWAASDHLLVTARKKCIPVPMTLKVPT